MRKLNEVKFAPLMNGAINVNPSASSITIQEASSTPCFF